MGETKIQSLPDDELSAFARPLKAAGFSIEEILCLLFTCRPTNFSESMFIEMAQTRIEQRDRIQSILYPTLPVL